MVTKTFYVSDKFMDAFKRGDKLHYVLSEKRDYCYQHQVTLIIDRTKSTHEFGSVIPTPNRPFVPFTKEDAENIKKQMQEKLNMDRYRRPLEEKMDRLKAELMSALILAGGDHKQKLMEGSFDQVIRSLLSNVSKEQMIKTISEFYES